MLRLGTPFRVPGRFVLRTYATAASPRTLILLEHRNGVIESSSRVALSAASSLKGDVTGLILGAPGQVEPIVEQAKKLSDLKTILHSTSDQYSEPIPELVSPLLEKLLAPDSGFTHFILAHTSSAKSIVPRVAAKLSVPVVSDVVSLTHDAAANSTTFVRFIYAGNAVSTVLADDSIPLKIFTVRPTALSAAPEGDPTADVRAIEPVSVPEVTTQHIRTQLTQSDRPELGAASRVVSGGRALKNAETFNKTLEPLADALGAAIGASRAAVDAGYADNSLQVGQTGKVVAPELYVAVGISGAIQHLAGMKDSKMIVAINKDADAPIFQVADAGLVADLYEAVPELVEKLKAAKE